MSGLDGSGFIERNGVLVPDSIPEKIEATCPAATVTRYKDTGRPAIICRVANDSFAVEENPMGSLGWCCGEYTDCPVWRSQKDGDPIVERQRIAREGAALRKQTERQVETGMRIDDRGVEDEQAYREELRGQELDPERAAHYRDVTDGAD